MSGLSLVTEAGHVIALLDTAISDGCRAAVHDAKRVLFVTACRLDRAARDKARADRTEDAVAL